MEIYPVPGPLLQINKTRDVWPDADGWPSP